VPLRILRQLTRRLARLPERRLPRGEGRQVSTPTEHIRDGCWLKRVRAIHFMTRTFPFYNPFTQVSNSFLLTLFSNLPSFQFTSG
jgi:hypothetical protein